MCGCMCMHACASTCEGQLSCIDLIVERGDSFRPKYFNGAAMHSLGEACGV